MRSRELSLPFPSTYWIEGIPYPLSPVGSFQGRSYSLIEDETRKVDGDGFHPCHHTKIGSAIFDSSVSITGNFDPQAYVRLGLGHRFPFSVPGLDWDSLVVALHDDVVGRLRTKTLLGVTIRELSATYQMVRNPFGLFRANWRKIAKNLSASSLAKSGANLWLEGMYGWGAGLYDLKNFCKAMRKYKSSLTDVSTPIAPWRSLANRASLELSSLAPVGDTMSNLLYYSSHPWQISSAMNCLSRIEAFMPRTSICLSCQASDRSLVTYSKLDKFLQASGLDVKSLLPSLWEILPYSFVVDWFVNFRASLARIHADQLLADDIRNLGYTIKTSIPFTVYLVCLYPWSAPIGKYLTYSPVISRTGMYTEFLRNPGLPASQTVLLGADLSASQSISGTSLIIQRVLR